MAHVVQFQRLILVLSSFVSGLWTSFRTTRHVFGRYALVKGLGLGQDCLFFRILHFVIHEHIERYSVHFLHLVGGEKISNVRVGVRCLIFVVKRV